MSRSSLVRSFGRRSARGQLAERDGEINWQQACPHTGRSRGHGWRAARRISATMVRRASIGPLRKRPQAEATAEGNAPQASSECRPSSPRRAAAKPLPGAHSGPDVSRASPPGIAAQDPAA